MKYLVTIEISGTKTYQFNNNTDFWLNEDEFRIWAHDNVERFDNMTNPISDSEHREIKDIKVVGSTMSKKQVYDKLAKYLEALTSNDEPLELLKMLKPEE
jgi:hypothetical protein